VRGSTGASCACELRPATRGATHRPEVWLSSHCRSLLEAEPRRCTCDASKGAEGRTRAATCAARLQRPHLKYTYASLAQSPLSNEARFCRGAARASVRRESLRCSRSSGRPPDCSTNAVHPDTSAARAVAGAAPAPQSRDPPSGWCRRGHRAHRPALVGIYRPDVVGSGPPPGRLWPAPRVRLGPEASQAARTAHPRDPIGTRIRRPCADSRGCAVWTKTGRP
jgi:hypothetical protein